MLVNTSVIDLTPEQQEFMHMSLQEQPEFWDEGEREEGEDRYTCSVIEEYFIQVEDEVSNETIAMAQMMVNTILMIQETNNIVLCNKNRRGIVEEIANSYGRHYSSDTALNYVNYVIDGRINSLE